ncbi:MAG: 30S ribosomal protein S9 [Candidatus Methanophagaceae archaeon]|jgi:small subunit ribosomal protein S9|nr:MAG: 30S ribosomal protein S9 [Methanophagales archaeon]KAF5431389.1 small subunit ribosomal protein S9 [Methanophagales archaeon]
MGTKVKVKKIINQVGKRKTAIARVTVKEGKGIVRINKKPLELLEPEVVRTKISEPLFIASEHPDVAGDVGSIELDVEVKGGGFMGQAEAARTAIARGLVDWTGNEGLKDIYLEYDRSLLVSDVRQKEPKKFGAKGARAHRQKSYR